MDRKLPKSQFFFVPLQKICGHTGRFRSFTHLCAVSAPIFWFRDEANHLLIMADNKILIIAQEIAPYLPANSRSQLSRDLPQSLQSKKSEIRIFMPKFGSINERRNQLHEVIRLSGVNIAINDNDHPLIIKVASMQPSRIQVYFIDNDDYFQKSDDDSDAMGSNREDNDERLLFFARGSLETAKKLRWTPNIVHYNGWFTALGPLYLKGVYNDDPAFKGSKIVYGVMENDDDVTIDPAIFDKLKADGVSAKRLSKYKAMTPDIKLLHKIAISNSDAVVFHSAEPDPELIEYASQEGKPYLLIDPASDVDASQYLELYSSL